eukprot:TRINITY_DN26631_c0_g2_i1.p1 TRINITY_DN26631_c0_g2~~TRINITY_DN26631_c0_g2_i1.p1  ORF type:complete len:406 (-),score=89.01 TRINITY_DN26631_c0_g2_i1:77-1294(-)
MKGKGAAKGGGPPPGQGSGAPGAAPPSGGAAPPAGGKGAAAAGGKGSGAAARPSVGGGFMGPGASGAGGGGNSSSIGSGFVGSSAGGYGAPGGSSASGFGGVSAGGARSQMQGPQGPGKPAGGGSKGAYAGGMSGGPGGPGMGGAAAGPAAPGTPEILGPPPAYLAGLLRLEGLVKWQLCFFAGGLATLAAGALALGYLILHFAEISSWSPSMFSIAVFLTACGVMMSVMDMPIAHFYPDGRAPPRQLEAIRAATFTFMMLVTRFTGRGMWYLFMASASWVVLYDSDICWMIGIAITIFLYLLGFASMAKGYYLSRKLHAVREMILDSKRGAESFITRGEEGMSKDQFSQMVFKVTSQAPFTEAEYDYILTALAWKHRHQAHVTFEEFEYWLNAPGYAANQFLLV